MSARKKSKGKIPGIPVAEPPTERERLGLQLQGNLGLLDALLRVDGSPSTTVQIEEAKERLRGICTQQQDLSQASEEHTFGAQEHEKGWLTVAKLKSDSAS